jgi:hypothetical protein
MSVSGARRAFHKFADEGRASFQNAALLNETQQMPYVGLSVGFVKVGIHF